MPTYRETCAAADIVRNSRSNAQVQPLFMYTPWFPITASRLKP